MPIISKHIRGLSCDSIESDFGMQRLSLDMSRVAKFSAPWGTIEEGWGSMDEDEMTRCCLPSGCPRYEADPISLSEPADCVRVVCNNEKCSEGQWMHRDCFQEWESHILSYLRSCGRARSWSEKQRHQNLWTKKGYDLAFKVCDCKCGRGRLKCDLNYSSSSPRSEEERRQKKNKRRERGQIITSAANGSQNGGTVNGADFRSLRIHRSSLSSTGSWSESSPTSSTGTTPVTTPGQFMPRKTSGSSTGSGGSCFSFALDADQAITGNIFRHRTDLHVFFALPHRRQNTYQIKTEDEGPHGNDEIRCQVLTSLSAIRATTVNCVICQSDLTVYDKYPLIDGTFFLSPVCYPGTPADLMVSDHRHRGAPQHLNAVCMRCLEGRGASLMCRSCMQPWYGAAFVIGTMYAYDIFGAAPCCVARLGCNRCRQPLCDPSVGLKYFSDYSRSYTCPCCLAEDFHFIKPLDEVFAKVCR